MGHHLSGSGSILDLNITGGCASSLVPYKFENQVHSLGASNARWKHIYCKTLHTSETFEAESHIIVNRTLSTPTKSKVISWVGGFNTGGATITSLTGPSTDFIQVTPQVVQCAYAGVYLIELTGTTFGNSVNFQLDGSNFDYTPATSSTVETRNVDYKQKVTFTTLDQFFLYLSVPETADVELYCTVTYLPIIPKLYVTNPVIYGPIADNEEVVHNVDSQGAWIHWNREGNGRTYIMNQKGAGTGGISFGPITTGNAFTEAVTIDSGNRLNAKAGFTVTGNTFTVNGQPADLSAATLLKQPGSSVSLTKMYIGRLLLRITWDGFGAASQNNDEVHGDFTWSGADSAVTSIGGSSFRVLVTLPTTLSRSNYYVFADLHTVGGDAGDGIDTAALSVIYQTTTQFRIKANLSGNGLSGNRHYTFNVQVFDF